jgi:pimeloyl-ACP methyl ester carboxylesterase
MSTTRTLAVIVLSSLLISACTANRMYRPDSIEREPGYALAFIEFDDQGEPWSPLQAQRAVETIQHANQRASGSVVLVFVHGWNNNASLEQEQKPGKSLYGFKQILARAAEEIKANNPTSTPSLIGIYIAWRGQSSYSILQPFTFFGRHRAAKRIAGTAATGTLFQLMAATKQNPKSRILLIGHSFGGLMVEQVIADVAAGELLGSDKTEVSFPADLVVLINPASSSLHAKELIDLLARQGVTLYRVDAKGNRYERPLMVSVTSAADTATRTFFPIGQSLGNIGKKFRSYGAEFCTPATGQRSYLIHTAGQYPVLYSHTVSAAPLPSSAAAAELDLREQVDPVSHERTISFNGEKERFTIKKQPNAFNDTPYWIARVPKSLIPNHSDVFGLNTVRLVQALVRVSGALTPGSRTVMERETSVRPIGLAVRASGALVFLDQLRRVYTVPRGSTQPEFSACLPGDVDPAAAIGAFAGPDTAAVVLSHVVLKGGEKKLEQFYATEFIPLPYDKLVPVKPQELKSSIQFLAASADLEGGKLYLATKEELYVADLAQKKPEPRPLIAIETSGQPGWMRFDPSRKRLLLPDNGSGRLYLVDLRSGAPRVQLAAEGLGAPTDVGIDAKTGMIYVADAKGKQIWRLRCDGACSAPQVLLRSSIFSLPSRLAVGDDGTIWVADLEARKIFAIDPQGTVQRTITSLTVQ